MLALENRSIQESNVYNNIANKHLENGEYEKALSFFLKAISLNSENSVLYHNAGVCLMLMNEYERAVSLFERALEKKIHLSETRFYRIQCLYEAGFYKKVIDAELPFDNNQKLECLVLQIRAAIKNGDPVTAKDILKKIKMMGYNSQELEFLENMIG